MLDEKFRMPVYAIYGFVRYSDEIVDTFHQYDKRELLENFKAETFKAIKDKISLNPVLHSFQKTANRYNITEDLIEAFLRSMEMDLYSNNYSEQAYEEYIYGSAEVVGLMCLKVFCEGDEKKYDALKSSARKLGAAFQKVNFLRDMKSDFNDLSRVYFPGVDFNNFNDLMKKEIEKMIQQDFDEAYIGIIRLPEGARFGVYLAYVYYLTLFRKIKKMSSSKVLSQRIRVPDNHKIYLLIQTYLKHSLNSL